MSVVQTQSEQIKPVEPRDEAFSSLFTPVQPAQPVQPAEADSQIDRRGFLRGCAISFFGGMPIGVHLARHQLQHDKYKLWVNEEYHFYFSQEATGSAFDDSLLSCRNAPHADALIVTQERFDDGGCFEHWLTPYGEYLGSCRLNSTSFREGEFFVTRGRRGDFSIADELDLEVLAGVLDDRRARVFRGRPRRLVANRIADELMKRDSSAPKKIEPDEYRLEDMI